MNDETLYKEMGRCQDKWSNFVRTNKWDFVAINVGTL